ncbi:SWI/SNF complex subunit SMARCC2 isoform X2 [Ixodes scapularis]
MEIKAPGRKGCIISGETATPSVGRLRIRVNLFRIRKEGADDGRRPSPLPRAQRLMNGRKDAAEFNILELEYQRQQLIQERQQFHLEQLRAAEFRARQQAHAMMMAQQGAAAAAAAAAAPPGSGGLPPQGGAGGGGGPNPEDPGQHPRGPSSQQPPSHRTPYSYGPSYGAAIPSGMGPQGRPVGQFPGPGEGFRVPHGGGGNPGASPGMPLSSSSVGSPGMHPSAGAAAAAVVAPVPAMNGGPPMAPSTPASTAPMEQQPQPPPPPPHVPCPPNVAPSPAECEPPPPPAASGDHAQGAGPPAHTSAPTPPGI